MVQWVGHQCQTLASAHVRKKAYLCIFMHTHHTYMYHTFMHYTHPLSQTNTKTGLSGTFLHQINDSAQLSLNMKTSPSPGASNLCMHMPAYLSSICLSSIYISIIYISIMHLPTYPSPVCQSHWHRNTSWEQKQKDLLLSEKHNRSPRITVSCIRKSNYGTCTHGKRDS